MLHSKATVALMRLKEIDKKYKVRQADNDRRRFSVSTESSPGSSERNYWYTEREQSRQGTLSKPKTSRLDVRMPETHFVEAYDKAYEAGDRHRNDRSSKVSSASTANAASGKSGDAGVDSQKSVLSTDSKMSSVEVPSSVTEVEEVTGLPGLPERNGEKSNEVSEVATTDITNDEESVTAKNESYGTKTDVTFRDSSMKDSSVKDSSVKASSIKTSSIKASSIKASSTKASSIQASLNTDVSEKLATTDEPSIEYDNDTFEEMSSGTMKTTGSKADRGQRISSEADVVIERHIGNKEVTSVIISPRRLTKHTVRRRNVHNPGNTEVIELISPKITESESQCEMELNKELSDYVKKLEETDIDPINLSPIRLLKPPNSAPSSAGRNRKKLKHRNKSSQRDPINYIDKTTTTQSLIPSRKQSPTDNTIRVEEKKDNSRKLSSRINQEAMPDKDARLEQKVEPASPRVASKKKKEAKREGVAVQQVDKAGRKAKGKVEHDRRDGGDSPRRKSAIRPTVNLEVNRGSNQVAGPATVNAEFDATRVLRKLNRDAINAVSGHCAKTKPPSGKQRSSKNHSGNRSHVDDHISAPSVFAKISKNNENIVQREHYRAHHDKAKPNTSKKKKGKKKTAGKGQGAERIVDGEKYIRFDSKHVQRLKKRIATLKLQQDKEKVRNYLLEMKAMRTGLGLSKFAIGKVDGHEISPLEFPKIEAFTPSDDIQKNHSGEMDELRHKLSTIRQWIKDQYILYRDYSNLAKIINGEYVSTDHLDIKKTNEKLEKELTGIR